MLDSPGGPVSPGVAFASLLDPKLKEKVAQSPPTLDREYRWAYNYVARIKGSRCMLPQRRTWPVVYCARELNAGGNVCTLKDRAPDPIVPNNPAQTASQDAALVRTADSLRTRNREISYQTVVRIHTCIYATP